MPHSEEALAKLVKIWPRLPRELYARVRAKMATRTRKTTDPRAKSETVTMGISEAATEAFGDWVKVACDCPGVGHDPLICASTVGQCRNQQRPGKSRICGKPAGHGGDCFARQPATHEEHHQAEIDELMNEALEPFTPLHAIVEPPQLEARPQRLVAIVRDGQTLDLGNVAGPSLATTWPSLS